MTSFAVAYKLHSAQIFSAALRMIPLGAKLALTFYMGRYLSLDAIGVYGLVVGAVMLLAPLLGLGLLYVVVRDIVGRPPIDVACRVRDLACFCLIMYVALAFVVIAIIASGGSGISSYVLWTVVVLTALEGLGAVAYQCMIVMHQQLWSSAVFCIRSGLWVVPVVTMGLIVPAWRTVDVVLAAWIMGAAISLVATLYLWRDLPWREAAQQPVDWLWMRVGLRKGFLIWLGEIGLTGGIYIDRFIINGLLTLSDVGVITFYGSFASALLQLVWSGVIAFSEPRMIQYHRDKNVTHLRDEFRRAINQAVLVSGCGSLLLALAVPLLGLCTGRAELVDNAPLLLLLLIGASLRAVSEVLFAFLYACQQDRAIWLGNLLFLIPMTAGNALLLPVLGLTGAGVSYILASGFLLIWRWWRMRSENSGELRESIR